jgi:predicted SnoaL-like aldol condensation-catalyzing enzyme
MAFLDMHTIIEHIIAENNQVVVFYTDLEPTKESFMEFRQQTNQLTSDLYRIESGVITGHWDVVDQPDLLRQTGALLSEAAVD